MNTKTIVKISIVGIVIFLILFLGITFQRRSAVKQNNNGNATVIVGLPKGQTGIITELDKIAEQYNHLDAGDRFFKKGDFDAAIKEYEISYSLAKSDGGKAVALLAIANGYEKKRDYKKALEYMIIDRDQYVNDWAKPPVVERIKYLEYALQGEYEFAVKHAQSASTSDKEIHGQRKESLDYIERLNDIIAAKEYIKSLKK
ncbi:MAG: hypothetical protein ABIH39_00010 [Candidatus Margulisiibacteriota bacterium]|nr:hypothetical protein [Candidatus Altiarchaeota archaeon]